MSSRRHDPTPQILRALLDPAVPAHPALEALRPEVITHTRAAQQALYHPEQPLPVSVLHALAAATAQQQESAALAAHHQFIDTSTDSIDPALHQALHAHALQLAVAPAQVVAEDHQHLLAVGATPQMIVLVSQLVAFEAYLQRLVEGLASLTSQDRTATEPVSDRIEPARADLLGAGRAAQHGGTIRTGRPRPTGYTREQLDWEPWIPVPSEAELTEEQRESFAAKATASSIYFRTIALTPGITAARSALDNAVFLPRDGLPKAERELAATATSRVNDCIYCASVHARKAAALAHREQDVDRLLAAPLTRDDNWRAADLTPLTNTQSGRWQHVVRVAAELSRPIPHLAPAHLEPLREEGLRDAEIADALTAAAFFAWANRLMLTLGEPSLPTSGSEH